MTVHDVTVRDVTLHDVTVRDVTVHDVTVRDVTVRDVFRFVLVDVLSTKSKMRFIHSIAWSRISRF